MAIRYWRPDEQTVYTGSTPFEDDSYAGSTLLPMVAGVAAAAALASACTASLGWEVTQDRDEIPAGKLLAGQPDEDFWQNPAAPVPATLYQRLPLLPDPEELPAGSLLKGIPDEDFWVDPPPTQPWTVLLPGVDDSAAFPPPPAIFDEDLWENPVAPVQASLFLRLPLGDVEELPAGSLKLGVPDEDFYSPPGMQQSWGVYVPPDDTVVLPAPTSVVDEVYWQNPVAPVLATMSQQQPYLPDQIEFSGPNAIYHPGRRLYGIPWWLKLRNRTRKLR